MAAGDVLGALMIGGVMGLVGQGARAALGLKKMNDLAIDKDLGWNDVFGRQPPHRQLDHRFSCRRYRGGYAGR